MSASAVYEGWVRHRRFEPVEHAFRYRLFLMYLDLEELPGVLDPYPVLVGPAAGAARFRRDDFMGDPGGLSPIAPATRSGRDRPAAPPARSACSPGFATWPLLQPGQLLLLLRPGRRAGRDGRRRRQEHSLG